MRLSMFHQVQDQKFIARRLVEGFPFDWIDTHGRTHSPQVQCYACLNRDTCSTQEIDKVHKAKASDKCPRRVTNELPWSKDDLVTLVSVENKDAVVTCHVQEAELVDGDWRVPLTLVARREVPEALTLTVHVSRATGVLCFSRSGSMPQAVEIVNVIAGPAERILGSSCVWSAY